MRLKLLKYFPGLCFFIFLNACVPSTENKKRNEDYLAGLKKDTSIKYAKRFGISENKNCRVLYFFGSRNIKDTSAIFVFLKDTTFNIPSKPKTYIFKSGCKNIASLSSIYTTMLCALHETDHITAVENIDYYNNKEILEKFNKGKLTELAKAPKIDVEKTIVLHPDVIFTFGMGNPEKDVDSKIAQANIPMVVIVDHLEETPLARAEWVKFFAAFVGKPTLADSIFNETKKRYTELKSIASTSKTKPTVFSEIKFGEIWYVPGGKSFAATLFNDANATYIWKDNSETGSLHLGFEEVYNQAKDADFWINMALVSSKKELFAQENRYAEFKAYKTGNLYNNIKTVNSKGYSDYWETGILYPDRILNDLILIFHPDLKPQLKNDLYYYKKLE